MLKPVLSTILLILAAVSIIILTIGIIDITNQVSEIRKYLPIAEFEFIETDFYKIDSARVYTNGKNAAPKEKLQLIVHVTNKLDVPLKFQPDIKVSLGGHMINHIENLPYDIVSSKSSNNLQGFDFYLAEEGPNEIEVTMKILFVNGTVIKEESVSSTIDVISLSNQLQIKQNQDTSNGVIMSAVIGIGTVIALLASLHYSRKEIESLNSQNAILKEESVRPYLQPTIVQKGPANIALSLKNVGTGAAIQVNFEYELKGKPETKRVWKKPLMDNDEYTNFFIPTGQTSKDFQMSYDYFKTNPTEIIIKITYKNIHGKTYTINETINVTEYVSQFDNTLEEYKGE